MGAWPPPRLFHGVPRLWLVVIDVGLAFRHKGMHARQKEWSIHLSIGHQLSACFYFFMAFQRLP